MYEVLINYIVKDDCCDDHISAVRQLFADLKKTPVEGVRLTVYKLEHVFLHVVRYQDKYAETTLTASYPYKEFLASLEKGLQEPPIINRITEIESYNCLT